jgi:hypothetical protein
MGLLQSGSLLKYETKRKFGDLTAFMSLNYDPNEYKRVTYTIDSAQTRTEYYIGGIIAAPCRNSHGVGCVFGANSVNDFTCTGTYITDWGDSSWGFNRFYMYSIPNLSYPSNFELKYLGNNSFEFYINNQLYLSLNNINVSVWNRSRLFYMGPGTDTEQNKLTIKDLTFYK